MMRITALRGPASRGSRPALRNIEIEGGLIRLDLPDDVRFYVVFGGNPFPAGRGAAAFGFFRVGVAGPDGAVAREDGDLVAPGEEALILGNAIDAVLDACAVLRALAV